MRGLALIFSFLCSPLMAHEFWIEPKAYQVPPDGQLEAHLVNGEAFAGTKQPYLPQRFAHFMLFTDEASQRVRGRPGDRPALNQAPLGEGLHIAAYEARNAMVNYPNWEKFQKFVDHKDFGDVLSRHQARDLPDQDFDEVYSRYSKTLFGVGNSVGSDQRVGFETEIVALTNPYTDNLTGGFRVQLHYRNEKRPDTQVEVFEKAADGAVTITLYRTDDQGIATFPVQPGHAYMVDAVVLRQPSPAVAEQTGAVWQTLWANLTFAVPE